MIDEQGESAEEVELTTEELEDISSVSSDAKPISYTGQDFDVDGLIKRLLKRDILIPTFGHDDQDIEAAGFQRAFVWRRPQMDKFIESILLGYPIPGVFLVKQSDNRYLVLDGQQRLLTLRFFHEGIYEGREFALRNVADDFNGLTYKKLPDDLRRQFDNTFIQAIIVTSDGTTESLESIYRIFERLNSGGTQLTPHEIRVALYAGPFIDFLEELNSNVAWRSLYGKKSPRLRDQELVLRIFGLVANPGNYKRPLKKFLNDIVAQFRNECRDNHIRFAEAFERASQILIDTVGGDAFRTGSQVNAALAEAVMVGLIRRLLDKGEPKTTCISGVIKEIKDQARDAISRSTADESQVISRITISTNLFNGV
uniref:DUF262 domain-containing protein n=1 Tax=uncultured Halomonas sp. TaxID=173971 RepID=UPI00262C0757|nr:DUF262 domain-containing protein [uncultured Halomonas sp.]